MRTNNNLVDFSKEYTYVASDYGGSFLDPEYNKTKFYYTEIKGNKFIAVTYMGVCGVPFIPYQTNLKHFAIILKNSCYD